MKILSFLLQKEFRQIFRDKGLLPVIFVMPMIQLLIMPLAANFDVKNINVAIVDHDHSSYTQKLVSKIGSSGYFRIVDYGNVYSRAIGLVELEKADVILEIPAGFERNLEKEGRQSVYLAADAINGIKGGLGAAYLSSVLADFNSQIQPQTASVPGTSTIRQIDISALFQFNPHLKYDLFMVPGILVILVTMVAGFISALNIVREKEIGTIEQINVSPIQKWQFILGKLIPFWLIGIFDFSAGLVIARLVYGIVPVGSLLVLYAFVAVYLVALLGFGLLISTFSDNQLQAMFVAFFFIMIFILMSGQFTPVENMPAWARFLSHCTPITYFIEVMRMVILKGSGFNDVKQDFFILLGFAVLLNAWAIWSYRKTS